MSRYLSIKEIKESKMQSLQYVPENPLNAYKAKAASFNAKINLIAEYKIHSPFKGFISNATLEEVILDYNKSSSIKMISILTSSLFLSSYANLEKARSLTDKSLLCKDFIISKKQVLLAKSCGADYILLIASLLGKDALSFVNFAKEKGLAVLLETSSLKEYLQFENEEVDLIGFNSRDLFSGENAAQDFDFGVIENKDRFVYESNLSEEKILQLKKEGIRNYLIGTYLMQKNPMQRKEFLQFIDKLNYGV